MANNHHQAVMLDELIKGLNIKSDGVYIDATFGRGGHTRAVLKQLNDKGRVIALDRDIAAINYASKYFVDTRLSVVHTTFTNMLNIVNKHVLVGKIDGIFFDLGVSSPQLDDCQRGFSFYKEGPLDMRMDQTQGMSAFEWLKDASKKQIADVLFQYGDERQSRKIASAIKKYQQNKAIDTTLQLANIISRVVKTKNKHPATRSFQAIRMFINQELQELSLALEQTIELLSCGGRIVVISFHSIEDRTVKQFIRKYSLPKKLPKQLPIMNSEIEKPALENLGKKSASIEEIKTNKRSRSAILRIVKKC